VIFVCTYLVQATPIGHTTKNKNKTLFNHHIMGALFASPRDVRGNIIFLRGGFALCPRVFLTLPTCDAHVWRVIRAGFTVLEHTHTHTHTHFHHVSICSRWGEASISTLVRLNRCRGSWTRLGVRSFIRSRRREVDPRSH